LDQRHRGALFVLNDVRMVSFDLYGLDGYD